MLVPTVPLVEQQAVHFVRHFYGLYYTIGISGAETLNNRADNLMAADVCVMTPQILV